MVVFLVFALTNALNTYDVKGYDNYGKVGLESVSYRTTPGGLQYVI